MNGAKPKHIGERSYEYALQSIRVFEDVRVSGHGAGYVLGKQFLRAATSVGANVEEAQSAESRADFIHKMSIAQKEARESLYWLRLMRDSGLLSSPQVTAAIEDSQKVTAILTAILVSAKRKDAALAKRESSRSSPP